VRTGWQGKICVPSWGQRERPSLRKKQKHDSKNKFFRTQQQNKKKAQAIWGYRQEVRTTFSFLLGSFLFCLFGARGGLLALLIEVQPPES